MKKLELQQQQFKILVNNLKLKARRVKRHLQDCERQVEPLQLDFTNSSPSSVLKLTLTSEMKVLNGGPSIGGVFIAAGLCF